MKHWVRAQVNCPAGDAARLRRLATAMNTVDGLGDALLDGHIGIAQAHELARLRAHPRVGDQLDSVSSLLLRHAEHLSYEEFRVVTRRWETLADLDGAERNDEASEARRKASVIEVGGAIDVRASGGSGLVTAELLTIFDRFVQAEFDKDVAARTAEFGPDAPASALPRSDSQRRFDALVAIFRAAVVAPANGVAPVPVLNLLVELDTFERLVTRRVTGHDPGLGDDLDLGVERMEADTGTAVSPDDVLAAAVIGHVRRVVIDGAGVVVDAGRKRNTHNPLKTVHRLRSKRDEFGNVVDFRDDGTAMASVGRRLRFDDPDVIPRWERRTVRVEFCRLGTFATRAALATAMSLDDSAGPS